MTKLIEIKKGWFVNSEQIIDIYPTDDGKNSILRTKNMLPIELTGKSREWAIWLNNQIEGEKI